MGIIDVPTEYGLMMKIPFYAMVFYTFNTLAFATGIMDSMLVPMMGTKPEVLDIVTGPILDGVFIGFTLCNAVIAALIYPMGDKATVKFQQLVTACFMFGFYVVMYFFYVSGMLGMMGIGQCVPRLPCNCVHRRPSSPAAASSPSCHAPRRRRCDERHLRRHCPQELHVALSAWLTTEWLDRRSRRD